MKIQEYTQMIIRHIKQDIRAYKNGNYCNDSMKTICNLCTARLGTLSSLATCSDIPTRLPLNEIYELQEEIDSIYGGITQRSA